MLAISGQLTRCCELEVTIEQSNWPQSLTINPVLIRAEVERVLHWRGQIGAGGILDTDHSFHSFELDSGVSFVQREEFHGSLAERMEPDARKFAQDAFRAMDERVQTQKQRGV